MQVVITSMRDEAVWIYINITDNKKKPFSPSNGVYAVHYFNTDYICIANLKASFRQYVCQVNIWGAFHTASKLA